MLTLFADLQDSFVIVAGSAFTWELAGLITGLLILAVINPLFRILRR